MPLRSYDPAIGRFTGIDPITHHSMSTYTAFDNNPAFFADPSGADGMPSNSEEYWNQINKLPWADDLHFHAGVEASGGNTGGGPGDPPKVYKGPGVVSEGSGMVNQLATVCIGCTESSGGHWSSEGDINGFSGSFSSYKSKYGFSGDYASVKEQYGARFGNSFKGAPWIIDATGFKANWDLGMQAPGGTGMAQFWDRTFGGLLMGTMALPIASAAGPGLGMQGLGSAVSDGATTIAARTYFNIVYRATPTVVNNVSYLTSRSVIGYSGQKFLMTHGRQYVDFGRAVLQNPAGLYTPGNFNFMHSRYTDFKRFKSFFE